MTTGIVIFLLALAIVVGPLIAFRRNALQPLPKNLPPPLNDDDEEKDQ